MDEFSLSTLADFAEIIGAGSIIAGLVFGWFQIRQYKVQRRDAIAVNLANTFYSKDLAQALALLQTLPDDIPLQEFRNLGSEYNEAAVTVTTSFETMGLLVFKRIAPLDLVLDLAGGIVSTMNRKLSHWLEDTRIEQDQPSWGEWFEWLGHQAIKVKTAHEPAHVRHKSWAP